MAEQIGMSEKVIIPKWNQFNFHMARDEGMSFHYFSYNGYVNVYWCGMTNQFSLMFIVAG